MFFSDLVWSPWRMLLGQGTCMMVVHTYVCMPFVCPLYALYALYCCKVDVCPRAIDDTVAGQKIDGSLNAYAVLHPARLARSQNLQQPMYCSVSYLPLHRSYSMEAHGVSSASGSDQAPQLERFVSRDQSSRDGFGMRGTAKMI